MVQRKPLKTLMWRMQEDNMANEILENRIKKDLETLKSPSNFSFNIYIS